MASTRRKKEPFLARVKRGAAFLEAPPAAGVQRRSQRVFPW